MSKTVDIVLKSQTRGHAILRNEQGAVLVEAALALPVLVILMIIATDFVLAIFAREQVAAAARAGAEYAAVRGYNSGAIQTAAQNAVANDVVTLGAIDPGTPFCGCVASQRLVPQTSVGTPPTCKGMTCTGVGATGLYPQLYTTVSVTGNYTPILPLVWGRNASNGTLIFTSRYTVRTN